jgi:hypothetical protein
MKAQPTRSTLIAMMIIALVALGELVSLACEPGGGER